MAIGGIGSYNPYVGSTPAGAAAGASPSAPAGASASQPASGASNSAYQYLVNYLKESPAQRMVDSWLAQHNLTEKALDAMPPAQQDAIRKQMAEDIKKKMQEGGGAGASAPGATVNIAV
jgi:hypothetical protein